MFEIYDEPGPPKKGMCLRSVMNIVETELRLRFMMNAQYI